MKTLLNHRANSAPKIQVFSLHKLNRQNDLKIKSNRIKLPESRTEGGEAVWAEVGAGAGSEGGQCKAEADAPDKEGADGTERGRRSEAEVATAAEEERGSVEFGVGNEIG